MAKKSLSHWDAIVKEAENGAGIYVGVDVHKNKYAVAVLSTNGVLHHFNTTADDGGLVRQFKGRGIEITCLAYEAGLTGFGLYRACHAAGIKAIVVAACRMPRPVNRSTKTDKVDCIKLAEFLSKGLPEPIAVPSPEQEAKRAKMRRRNLVTKEVAAIKVRIKSFLTVHGLPEPAGLKCWNDSGLEALSDLEMLPDLRSALNSMLRQYNFLLSERKLLEKELKEETKQSDDVLQSVPGVGPMTSAAFRTEIFDPERFGRSEQLAAFIGLAPIISQSGNKMGTAKLVPCGQGKLRGMLIEAAWILMRKEAWAADFYQRIFRRCGVCQKAICALARKLAVILWKLLLDNRYYRSDYSSPKEFSA